MTSPAPRAAPDLLAVLGLGSVTGALLLAAAPPLAGYPLESHPGALARAAVPALVLAMVTVTTPATVLVLAPEAVAPTWVLLAAGLQRWSAPHEPAPAAAPEVAPAPWM